MNEIVRGSRQNDVFINAGGLICSSLPIEEKVIGLVLPGTKTWTGASAASATLFAVAAVIRS